MLTGFLSSGIERTKESLGRHVNLGAPYPQTVVRKTLNSTLVVQCLLWKALIIPLQSPEEKASGRDLEKIGKSGDNDYDYNCDFDCYPES
jgi:hypothetical protein